MNSLSSAFARTDVDWIHHVTMVQRNNLISQHLTIRFPTSLGVGKWTRKKANEWSAQTVQRGASEWVIGESKQVNGWASGPVLGSWLFWTNVHGLISLWHMGASCLGTQVAVDPIARRFNSFWTQFGIWLDLDEIQIAGSWPVGGKWDTIQKDYLNTMEETTRHNVIWLKQLNLPLGINNLEVWAVVKIRFCFCWCEHGDGRTDIHTDWGIDGLTNLLL